MKVWKRTPIPIFGAVGFHWRSAGGQAGWMLDLLIWRRGPWRASWTVFGAGGSVGGHVETPRLRPLANPLARGLSDLAWAVHCRRNPDDHA